MWYAQNNQVLAPEQLTQDTGRKELALGNRLLGQPLGGQGGEGLHWCFMEQTQPEQTPRGIKRMAYRTERGKQHIS